jgi:putative pyruvate formate lyase activating enzyme
MNGDVVVRGMIIRHLILPNDLSETEKVFKFIAEELSPKIHISLNVTVLSNKQS